jgi:transcriptional regulator with XRE-family HTH domain
MRNVDRDLDRIRYLLRRMIVNSGLTQTEIQTRCSWGRGSLSQMLSGRKTLKVEAVLIVLDVLGIEPRHFFAQLYGSGTSSANAYRYIDAVKPRSGGDEDS